MSQKKSNKAFDSLEMMNNNVIRNKQVNNFRISITS